MAANQRIAVRIDRDINQLLRIERVSAKRLNPCARPVGVDALHPHVRASLIELQPRCHIHRPGRIGTDRHGRVRSLVRSERSSPHHRTIRVHTRKYRLYSADYVRIGSKQIKTAIRPHDHSCDSGNPLARLIKAALPNELAIRIQLQNHAVITSIGANGIDRGDDLARRVQCDSHRFRIRRRIPLAGRKITQRIISKTPLFLSSDRILDDIRLLLRNHILSGRSRANSRRVNVPRNVHGHAAPLVVAGGR